MRTKLFVILIVGGVVSVLSLYTAGQVILMRSYEQLETQEVEKNVERTLSVLSNEFDDLDSRTADYAGWDDTYEFIEDLNQNYIQVNLVDSTFTNLRVDVIIFIKTSGEVAYSQAFDLDTLTEVPVSPSLLNLVSNNDLLWKHSSTDEGVSGLVSLDEGPMLIASKPILTSQYEGPIRGTMIMGRYLDSTEIDYIASTTHLPLVVTNLHDPDDREPETVLASLSKENPIFVQPLNGNEIAGYALVSDVFGEPYLVFNIDLPRSVYQQGQVAISYFILSFLTTGIVLSLVLFIMLEKSVLSQVDRLTADVRNLGQSKSVSGRLSWKRTDELSILADAIDSMMEQRLNAIAELAAMVGHDLRNPLTGIASAVYYLKMKLKPEAGSRTQEMFETIDKDIEYSNKIVNDLLEYSRKTSLDFKDSEMQSILRDALSLVDVPSNVQLLDLTENNVTVRVDVDKIKRVFVNLIKNSIEAMPEGGKLTIKSKTTKDKVGIIFSDTGPGMSKEVLDKIFIPLFTTKAKGMGLGLAICKRVVEAHGGSITAESTLGKGTTFTVTIPVNGVADGGDRAA
jgi:sensor domain CHASE-containing protein/two-component sensor histidine kinase